MNLGLAVLGPEMHVSRILMMSNQLFKAPGSPILTFLRQPSSLVKPWKWHVFAFSVVHGFNPLVSEYCGTKAFSFDRGAADIQCRQKPCGSSPMVKLVSGSSALN